MMETNPYEYDKPVPWYPRQNQLYESGYVSAPARPQPAVPQNQRLPHTGAGQKPKTTKAMPKARALALARSFKKGLVVASVVSFGTFSGLAAFHQVGTTTSQATHSSSTSSGSSQSTSTTTSSSQSTSTSTTTSSSQNSSGFFNQQGGNNLGTSSSSSTAVSSSTTS